jgi:hypothetical protein
MGSSASALAASGPKIHVAKPVSAKSETRSCRAVSPRGISVQVQPVKAGTTWSGDTVVVVVDGGTGPVNDSTNVLYPLFPVSV